MIELILLGLVAVGAIMLILIGAVFLVSSVVPSTDYQNFR